MLLLVVADGDVCCSEKVLEVEFVWMEARVGSIDVPMYKDVRGHKHGVREEAEFQLRARVLVLQVGVLGELEFTLRGERS